LAHGAVWRHFGDRRAWRASGAGAVVAQGWKRVSEAALSDRVARPAILALEDGRIFNGRAAGALTRRGGEVVFNTSLTGYQEVFTDPSYSGQIVCLTYPHIGNVGTNLDDQESERPYIEALIVREFAPLASNWRSSATAQAYLQRYGIPVIWDLDTRALVRHIRKVGALRGVVSTDGTVADQLIAEARALPTMAGLELAGRVTCGKAYAWQKGSIELAISPSEKDAQAQAAPGEQPYRVVAYDFGIKQNILRLLVDLNCSVTVVPARTSAEDVLALKPHGVFLSNGPGDPEPITYAVESIRKLLGRVPVFGICLGHQLCGLALGGRTYKLKFGHHGSNHPVKNLTTGQVEITAQNHGFVVDPESLPSSDVEVTHVNLNDQTNEGMRHRSLPLFSVQYHPEASPGPHDSHYLFHRFADMMKEHRT
jgi:carbamoyl-phosphate synthase small subunit